VEGAYRREWFRLEQFLQEYPSGEKCVIFDCPQNASFAAPAAAARRGPPLRRSPVRLLSSATPSSATAPSPASSLTTTTSSSHFGPLFSSLLACFFHHCLSALAASFIRSFLPTLFSPDFLRSSQGEAGGTGKGAGEAEEADKASGSCC